MGRLRKAARRVRFALGGEKETVLEIRRKKGCRYASEPAEEENYYEDDCGRWRQQLGRVDVAVLKGAE